MPTLQSLVAELDKLLAIDDYADYCINGLQVQSSKKKQIKNVCIAVDAGSSTIAKAVEHKADLLIVHHGIFWGTTQAITGAVGVKVEALLQGECSLYACHLPLDGNLEFGNAAELARLLELDSITPAFMYKGKEIGVIATASPALSLETIAEKARGLAGFTEAKILPFGSVVAEKIGIITGSGSDAIAECKHLGLDTLISGEPKHEAYHAAKDNEMNALFLGHYATETLGVKAIGRYLSDSHSIKVTFLDEPSGI